MALFKNKNANKVPLSPRGSLLQKYNNSRNNLLLVVIFTLVNMVMLIVGSSSYFLFSASIPYYLTLFGMLYTGRMPEEIYSSDWEGFQFYDTSYLAIMLAISVVLVAVYVLCWIMGKKHGFGWLIFALISFIIDTIFMFVIVDVSADMILDVVFHAWVIISLGSGIAAALKLNKMPPEENEPAEYQGGIPEMPAPLESGAPIENIPQPILISATDTQINEIPQETVNDIPEEK